MDLNGTIKKKFQQAIAIVLATNESKYLDRKKDIKKNLAIRTEKI